MVRHYMSSRTAAFLIVFLATAGFARDKVENWIQVTTQHFTVYCNGNEKQARKIGDEFEHMRALFHMTFPNIQIDPPSPIMVIAVKDAKDFRALEPESYLAKGQLQLAGLFLRAPDKNYVLVRLDAPEEHPFATVYHEYTHLLLSKAESWFPLWLNEGLAEFYQNTEIQGKDTVLGEASSNDILWLGQNKLLPIPTLITVDHNSPYYHEEHKGSIFYAESWALTHYLKVKEAQTNTNLIHDYVVMVSQHDDSITAATKAFGDLQQLQKSLEAYVAQSRFSVFKLTKPLEVDQTNFKVAAVSSSQANAVRADFLAYNHREKDSGALLDQVLHDDPNNTLAHETMGYLAFRAGNLDEAENWYGQAVKLDSQSFLAYYDFASIAMSRGKSDDDALIESSLQKAVKLNPSFAPSYDQLAIFYGMRHKNLDDARTASMQAIQLDPGNLRYRLNAANVLLTMQREKDALAAMQSALQVAKSPAEVSSVQSQIEMIQQSITMRQVAREANQSFQKELKTRVRPSDSVSADATEPDLKQPDLVGPRRFVTGAIRNVHCFPPTRLTLEVNDGQATLNLQTTNYYKLAFTAVGFTPTGELHPCSDLEGMHGKVEYVTATEPGKTGSLISVELHK